MEKKIIVEVWTDKVDRLINVANRAFGVWIIEVERDSPIAKVTIGYRNAINLFYLGYYFG